MSVTLWIGLCLQGAAVALMRLRLGRTWLRRPVTVLVLTAVTYSGFVEVLLSFPSIRVWDTNRLGIGQSYIDSAVLSMSAGLLALVACYLATRPERAEGTPAGPELAVAARVLDWRVFAGLCLPMALATYAGHGYNSDTAATNSVNLASEFLVMLVALASFSFLLRYGMRWFVPVLIAQSVFLATAGERNPLLTDAIVLLILLAQVGMRPSRRQVVTSLALVAVTILAITGYRAEAGRTLFSESSGPRARLEAIGNGLHTVFHASSSGSASPGLIAQAATRFDGNAFAGGVLQGLRSGDRPLGAADVAQSALVVVPSALWPSKLSHSAGLNPTVTEISEFGLQPVADVAIAPLPTFLGQYLGFLGSYWLIAFLAGLGLIFGCAERWLLRRFTVARLVGLGAAVQAAFAYEAGLPIILVGLRTALVLAGLVKLMQAVRAAYFPAVGEVADPGAGRLPGLTRLTGAAWQPGQLTTGPAGPGQANMSLPYPVRAQGTREPVASGR